MDGFYLTEINFSSRHCGHILHLHGMISYVSEDYLSIKISNLQLHSWSDVKFVTPANRKFEGIFHRRKK